MNNPGVRESVNRGQPGLLVLLGGIHPETVPGDRSAKSRGPRKQVRATLLAAAVGAGGAKLQLAEDIMAVVDRHQW